MHTRGLFLHARCMMLRECVLRHGLHHLNICPGDARLEAIALLAGLRQSGCTTACMEARTPPIPARTLHTLCLLHEWETDE